MTRRRQERADLTESWDHVDDGEYIAEEPDEEFSEQEDEVPPMRSLRSSRADMTNSVSTHSLSHSGISQNTAIPQLVMPSSPNAGVATAQRVKTPHLRANDRSMTSDAGAFASSTPRARPRAQTPRSRLNERSMTSDLGQFTRKRSVVKMDPIQDADPENDSSVVSVVWTNMVNPVLRYTGDVVGLAFKNAKPLFGYLLVAYALGALLVFGSNFLRHTIDSALSPICRIPGVVYWFSPSFCSVAGAPQVEGVAEFDKLVQVQSAFDEVLEASSSGVTLPMDMKRSEASIRDLKHVVQYSTLPSRNELVFEFNGFIDTARQASQDLSRFNSRVGRAVDHILSTNRWTLSVIDGVAASHANQGSITRFFSDHLNIFAPFFPVSLSQDILLDQYLRHTVVIEDQILSLITEAQALLMILENLDGRLDVISEISTRDGLKTQDARDDIFGLLWTKLGGNRGTVKRYDQQLELLSHVGQYRRIAWAHVTATVVKLQAIRNNLEDLRERVGAPETLGTDRVPLEMHIASINLGIERLEMQRDANRAVEKENIARVIGRAEAGDERFIAGREV